MKAFQLSLIYLLVAVASFVAAALPRFSEGIGAGIPTIDYLRSEASQGRFSTLLPRELWHDQMEWEGFLLRDGKRVVDDMYKNQAYLHGKDRILRAVTLQGDKYIEVDTLSSVKVHTFKALVNLFAHQKVEAIRAQQAAAAEAAAREEAEKRKQWGRNLSLGREGPGPSHF
ncbi:uncharacterized protein UTRI_03319 [Ustilago trichophora]|uniref:Uncharacterized protein n=1 Tax=Ustilago trichophora TaxID=86804 RepID=A0A5C3E5H4_9BASI|nr:uncharacterized protein UTRI_03319 [Ustilago trichophora]